MYKALSLAPAATARPDPIRDRTACRARARPTGPATAAPRPRSGPVPRTEHTARARAARPSAAAYTNYNLSFFLPSTHSSRLASLSGLRHAECSDVSSAQWSGPRRERMSVRAPQPATCANRCQRSNRTIASQLSSSGVAGKRHLVATDSELVECRQHEIKLLLQRLLVTSTVTRMCTGLASVRNTHAHRHERASRGKRPADSSKSADLRDACLT